MGQLIDVQFENVYTPQDHVSNSTSNVEVIEMKQE